MNSEDLAAMLRERRKTLGITQRDLAQIAGISLHAVIVLESGRANPTLDVLSRVLSTLGLKLDISPGFSNSER